MENNYISEPTISVKILENRCVTMFPDNVNAILVKGVIEWTLSKLGFPISKSKCTTEKSFTLQYIFILIYYSLVDEVKHFSFVYYLILLTFQCLKCLLIYNNCHLFKKIFFVL